MSDLICFAGRRLVSGGAYKSKLSPYCIEEALVEAKTYDPSSQKEGPATSVTWNAAREYCQSIGGDLPTKDQLEGAVKLSIVVTSDDVSEWTLDKKFSIFRKFFGKNPVKKGMERLWSQANGYSLPTLALSRVGFRCVSYPRSSPDR